jgi:hypothetical protein
MLASVEPEVLSRFYRVGVDEWRSNAALPTITLSNLSQGTVISNQFAVAGLLSADDGISGAELRLDGVKLRTDSRDTFQLPFDSRRFPNGAHRLTVVAKDAGFTESTEQELPAQLIGPGFNVTNVTVVLSNFLSDVRLKFLCFDPTNGQTQVVYGTWLTPRMWRLDITPRGDPDTVYRSFSGEGGQIIVPWDGKDSSDSLLDPQRVDYNFYDLGEASSFSGGDSVASGGVSLGGAKSVAAAEEFEKGEITELPPLPWDKETERKILGDIPPPEPIKQPSTVLYDSGAQKGSSFAQVQAQSGTLVMTVTAPYMVVGTIGVLAQGHHPYVGSYPTPPRFFGNVRMSSDRIYGPWGRLGAPRRIVQDLGLLAQYPLGYRMTVKKLDDQVTPEDLKFELNGGSNTLRKANLGLFIGHSVAGRDFEIGYNYRQSYIPIYNSQTDTMTSLNCNDMFFGTGDLKWIAFFSCNLLRSEFYRDDGVCEQLQNNFALPMSGLLHILQAYATEMSVHNQMAERWIEALTGDTSSSENHSVIGAWSYVCRRTQPRFDSDINVARSLFWPECQGDFLYGFGPQTDPDRDPSDPLEQADLAFIDARADDPEP